MGQPQDTDYGVGVQIQLGVWGRCKLPKGVRGSAQAAKALRAISGCQRSSQNRKIICYTHIKNWQIKYKYKKHLRILEGQIQGITPHAHVIIVLNYEQQAMLLCL